MNAFFSRIYDFLLERWHIPFKPEHYFDLLVLLGVVALAAFYAVFQAGMSAFWLPDAARLFAVLLSFHVFALARRCGERLELSWRALWFLPALLWLAADWLFFAEKPWRAEINFISTLTAAGLFVICLYHLRQAWLKWILVGMSVLVASLLASPAWGEAQSIAELYLGRKISASYAGMFCGFPGNPAATGALLLLAFFPAAAIALSRNRLIWARLAAGYAAAVLLFGIYMTHHVGVWLGCFGGTMILVCLVLGEKFRRIVLILLTIGVFAWLAPRAKMNVGMLFSPPAPTPEAVSENGFFSKVPLAHTALKAVKTSPVYGLGTGGFEVFFEKNRPAEWRTTPATPGSLPLTVLAEFGIVGFLLIAVPVCRLWYAGLRACLGLPKWEFSGKLSMQRSNAKKRRRVYDPELIVPEGRILLGGILSGTAGATLLLCLDYPGFMPAVLCAFAINGAILLGTIRRNSRMSRAGHTMRNVLRAGVLVVPACWLLWVLPPLTSASLAERAGEVVNKFLPTPENPASGYRLDFGESQLAAAGEAASKAIYYNPRNADALATFAKSALRLSAFRPGDSDRLGAEALAASAGACEIEPGNADFLLVHGASLYMSGDTASAFAYFRAALDAAPRNLSVLLTVGDFLTQQSSLHAEALAAFDKASRLYPENEYAQRRKSFLVQIGAVNESEVKK